ncbi:MULTISPECIES: PD-(D/E)XK nuclease family protein [unclassified Nodularia (in: cyanobacteria)]|uniref:PD-(D/E)XK nuclease family protein n=1 Tax=unclassified Nodularia (in: cyanobacteria) TaxID=2656917 RepID=UPI001882B8D8|nr:MULTISPECIES: PD-(D/E)XK nuclease family protein [unclassified Nodularia (in: cyanobacteria)]MBE9197705.1 PD-(D/E)XK nuclease family protein [Nodularia sp. LEGE 06071]MCC2692653.1 PD-(D/E)XK nuclease family protein [Nodularia sp. LEGE 04288]
MLSETTPLLRLSQGHLNLLEACPRKFQHTYLEQLNTPLNPEHEEHQTLGSQFHLLMQQREMGLPIGSFLEVDTQLQSWMSGFTNAAPEILTPIDSQTFRESEHYRILQVQDYLLTVVYDLFIGDSQKAQILDWKTYPKPQNKRKLEQNWQTRLYLYVLAETSDYLPKNISMTYWFVQSEGQPQNITFNYNSTQHQQTAKKLNQLLNKLTNWLEDYQIDQRFPQVPENSQDCNYCHFATRCNRTQSSTENQQNYLPNLANIQEVAL